MKTFISDNGTVFDREKDNMILLSCIDEGDNSNFIVSIDDLCQFVAEVVRERTIKHYEKIGVKLDQRQKYKFLIKQVEEAPWGDTIGLVGDDEH